MGCVYLIIGQLIGGHLQATEDQFANQGYNITSFYKRLVGTIMPAHYVPTQKGNVAISLPVPSIPWNEQTATECVLHAMQKPRMAYCDQ